jgi:hypothetical protein
VISCSFFSVSQIHTEQNHLESSKLLEHHSPWSYQGQNGPQKWVTLSPENVPCGNGQEQSPVDIGYFEALLHFAVVETVEKDQFLVAASYAGLETSVRAISAGILESRVVNIEANGTFYRTKDPYKRIERPMGMGDVAHGMVLSSRATMNGLEEGSQTYAYVFFSPTIRCSTAAEQR